MHERSSPGPTPDRYLRQTLFAPLGPEGQGRLRRSRVLLVGCGALGCQAAEQLARAGVGSLRLVDRDVVELSNLHRQSAFTEEDAREGAPKAQALAAWLSRVNSEVEVEPLVEDFRHTNCLELAEGAQLLVDGSDNVPARFLLNEVSLERTVPWIQGGVVGDSGEVQAFFPGRGPCLRCLLRDLPAPGELPTCDTAGVLGPAAGIAASFQAALAIRCLSAPEAARETLAGKRLRFRAFDLRAGVSSVPADPSCPTCAGGGREFLAGKAADGAVVLCGRKGVQVSPPAREARLDLTALAARLRPLGRVEERRHLLRFDGPEGRLTFFPDGRAIVEGSSDPGRARALYARYVGA